jgi:hypothetical protein
MKNDIATLKKRGWTFEEGEAGKGTFANRQKRVIVDKNELGNRMRLFSLCHMKVVTLYMNPTLIFLRATPISTAHSVMKALQR